MDKIIEELKTKLVDEMCISGAFVNKLKELGVADDEIQKIADQAIWKAPNEEIPF